MAGFPSDFYERHWAAVEKKYDAIAEEARAKTTAAGAAMLSAQTDASTIPGVRSAQAKYYEGAGEHARAQGRTEDVLNQLYGQDRAGLLHDDRLGSPYGRAAPGVGAPGAVPTSTATTTLGPASVATPLVPGATSTTTTPLTTPLAPVNPPAGPTGAAVSPINYEYDPDEQSLYGDTPLPTGMRASLTPTPDQIARNLQLRARGLPLPGQPTSPRAGIRSLRRGTANVKPKSRGYAKGDEDVSALPPGYPGRGGAYVPPSYKPPAGYTPPAGPERYTPPPSYVPPGYTPPAAPDLTSPPNQPGRGGGYVPPSYVPPAGYTPPHLRLPPGFARGDEDISERLLRSSTGAIPGTAPGAPGVVAAPGAPGAMGQGPPPMGLPAPPPMGLPAPPPMGLPAPPPRGMGMEAPPPMGMPAPAPNSAFNEWVRQSGAPLSQNIDDRRGEVPTFAQQVSRFASGMGNQILEGGRMLGTDIMSAIGAGRAAPSSLEAQGGVNQIPGATVGGIANNILTGLGNLLGTTPAYAAPAAPAPAPAPTPAPEQVQSNYRKGTANVKGKEGKGKDKAGGMPAGLEAILPALLAAAQGGGAPTPAGPAAGPPPAQGLKKGSANVKGKGSKSSKGGEPGGLEALLGALAAHGAGAAGPQAAGPMPAPMPMGPGAATPPGFAYGMSDVQMVPPTVPPLMPMTPPPRFAQGTPSVEPHPGYPFGAGYLFGANEVPGQGTGRTDTVPAMLAPHEAVLNRAAADLLGRGLIAALNAHGVRQMGMSRGAPA
jgi:hypothetical protein